MMRRVMLSMLCLTGLSASFSSCTLFEPGKVLSETSVPSWVHGKWIYNDDKGKQTTVSIFQDGSALGIDNTIGSWYYIEDRLYIVWMNGWTDVIFKDGSGYKKLGFQSGSPTDGPPTNTSMAKKLQ